MKQYSRSQTRETQEGKDSHFDAGPVNILLQQR